MPGRRVSVTQEVACGEIKEYGNYIAERYNEQTASSTASFLPLTDTFHRLAIIKKERFRRRKRDDNKRVTVSRTENKDDNVILPDINHIEIKNILCKINEKRIVLLIEGIPGSGKSTLSLHICQQWGKHELFSEYDLVILVRLRDPEVQKADSIEDLLPCRDDAMACRIANEIKARDGRKILWILDGWDELPSNLQDSSLFWNMITAPSALKTSIPQSDIIVTSRPISSIKLQRVASSRIEILGFTVNQQEKYFEECFKRESRTHDFPEFLEIIRDSTVLQSLCCVPQYAAYIVNIYLCEGQASLATEYDIFSSVIVNCVHRHFEKMGQTGELLEDVELIVDLANNETTKSSFDTLCELAYRGVMKNKVAFLRSDLPNDFNHLGLLQGVQSLASHGRGVVSYSFANLSIQEVLASYYLATKVPVSDQPEKLKELFHEPRFNAVLKFYAAITKLKSPGIRDILIKVIQEMDIPKLLSLLHCLHEAQNDALCRDLAQELSGVLYLFGKPLSPLDSFVVGYLLSNICISIKTHKGLSSVTGEFRADLDNCQLGDQGCKSLVKGVRKYLNRDCGITSQAILELAGNAITAEGVGHIAELLLESDIVSKLTLGHLLSGNQIESRGLQLLTNALIRNKSLTELDLSNCSFEITSENGPSLEKMLQSNMSLKCLLFRNTHISDNGISFIANGLSGNTAITALRLYNRGITRKGAQSIGKALKVNTTLQLLNLSHNPIGGDGAKCIADGLAYNRSLTTCVLDGCEIDDEGFLSLVDAVNNSFIKSLWLEGNPAISVKKHVLMDALSKNGSIDKIVLPAQFSSERAEIEKELNEKRNLFGRPIHIKLKGICILYACYRLLYRSIIIIVMLLSCFPTLSLPLSLFLSLFSSLSLSTVSDLSAQSMLVPTCL